MTTENTTESPQDQRRIQRMEETQLQKYQPTEPELTEASLEVMYLEPRVVARGTFLAKGPTIYCHECVRDDKDHLGVVRAFRLHTLVEPDIMKNFEAMITYHCFGCGFHEMVPLKEDMQKAAHEAQSAMSQKMAAYAAMRQQALDNKFWPTQAPAPTYPAIYPPTVSPYTSGGLPEYTSMGPPVTTTTGLGFWKKLSTW